MNLENIEMLKIYLYGGDIRLLHFLCILMLVDIVTGIAKAVYNKNLWSRKSLFGFARKLMVFCIIVLANIIDQILQLNGGLVIVTIMFYIANEGLSIVENCAQMGVLIPTNISEKLAVILSENDKQSITTEAKEEFTAKHSKDLPGGQVDVSVKVQAEKNEEIH
ncbi:holin family protein [Macrococcoides caseolyticum]|uniref:phage holin family protein n=1 Tax=Macrococcoides caseolyticum TaxID=69966 RepID=UPI0018E3B6FF